MDEARLDRTALSIVDLSQQGKDVAYWRSRPGSERLAAIETLRQIMYGYDPTSTRLQRVLEVAELKRR